MQLNTWELLQIRIPEPLVNFGMFPITSKKLGILGGKYSKRVFVLEVQEMQIDNHMERRYLFPSYDHFRLHEVTGLTENIETIFPPVLDEGLE